MTAPLVDKIRQIVTAPTEAAGYELVKVEWKHEPGGWVVRIFIDQPEGFHGGISHSDCERVSRELSAVLDVEDTIPHAYSLEVSSPGLDRPLVTPQHFRRFVGKRAKVRLQKGIEGRRNFSGTIVSVSDQGTEVTLDVDGRSYALPLEDLDSANLQYQGEQ